MNDVLDTRFDIREGLACGEQVPAGNSERQAIPNV
jgi:hypothetical protein